MEERGSKYSVVRANRIAFHPKKDSEEPGFFRFVLDARLAGMALPTSQAQLHYLRREQNVGLVCSLIEKPSCPPLSMFQAEDSDDGVLPDSFWLDWPDMTPPTIQQMDALLEVTETYLNKGLAVVYHCFAGKGRTGTALCCALLKFGDQNLDAAQVLQHVRDLRPGSVETFAQEYFIQQYDRHLKKLPPLPEVESPPRFLTFQLRKTKQEPESSSSTTQ